MAELHPLADIHADPLVMGVVNGDRSAWFRLTLHIEDWVEEHAPRHWRMRKARLARSEDDVRDVLLETLERVDRNDFRVLRQYLEQKLRAVPDVRSADSEPVSFVAWLAALVDFAIRDHVRRRYGRAPAQSAQTRDVPAAVEQPPVALSKRSLQSWAVHPREAETADYASQTPSLSRIVTARSILRYAEQAFDARELSLFRRYLEHASFEELALEFEFARPELARAEIRKLKERLRARFRDAE